MNNYFITMALTFLRWYIGSGVFDRISSKVIELMKEDTDGAKKKQIVMDFAKNEYITIKTKAVAAVIEMTLLANDQK